MTIKEIREMTFGKYKGITIFELIITHIGYIMWCLKNVNSFYLNEEEQDLYDAVAISVIRDDLYKTFPLEGLKEFIKDKKSLEKLDSPVMNDEKGSYLSYPHKTISDIFLYVKNNRRNYN